ncbi:adenylyl-sulfate kinase [Pseudoduganella namucuonensis]|uniref:Adenylyl-sulfate kinase n=1 Tax=Pseudoduganella namucuonensis TaxID=1035707 RepID=A0A1I7M1X9_9BURK|nr:adenylyl-sulfate kinase [Pseudoduganella namucuonensis]SFV15847.1 adenylylsulfate kinase [Pseudoduganella namucuonensis]
MSYPKKNPAPSRRRGDAPSNIYWHPAQAKQEIRHACFGARPATVWLTGLSGAGKSTIAYELEQLLLRERHPCYVLDGDNLRHHLNRDLGFSAADRSENIRRAAEVAHLMNEAGLIVITAFISPLRQDRDIAREIVLPERFVEVHVSTALALCEERDPKGLYARARQGQIPEFTGISAPYEAPLSPTLTLDTGAASLAHSTRRVYQHLARHFFVEQP